jgi:hypothetical protein
VSPGDVAIGTISGFCLGLAGLPLAWVELAFARRSDSYARDVPAFLLGATCGFVALSLGALQSIYTTALLEGGGFQHASAELTRFLDQVARRPSDYQLLPGVLAFASLPFGVLVVARVRGLSLGRQCRFIATRMGALALVFVLGCLVAFPWIVGDRKTASLIVFAAFVTATGTALPLLTRLAERVADRLEDRLSSRGE